MLTFNNEGALVTTRDGAASLGIDYITFLRMVQRGEIPAVKIGKSYRIHPAVIERYRRDALIGGHPQPLAR